ncbi:MAG: response regulator, partial [Rhodovulum sp.]
LEGSGHRIVPAPSGDAAWQLFQRDPGFDLVITDVVMPGALQGPALAERLRGLRPDLPVLFLSGHDFGSFEHHPGVRPDDIRLPKPVPRRRLTEAISMALAGR